MAGAEYSDSARRSSGTQLLEELEQLSQSLYHAHISTTRRTASLALPRTSLPSVDQITIPNKLEPKSSSRPLARRMSLSPWRSRPKLDEDDNNIEQRPKQPTTTGGSNRLEYAGPEKKGIWNWKPIRALSHIGMQKLSCLLSVDVVTAQGLPPSMNGLRLSVCVRKKETKDGAVHTMPSRVSQGAADFEETLFVRCHVYCTSAAGNGKHLKFEPRPFWIYLFAVDAPELDFGRNSVDLSQLIQESVDKSLEGTQLRQWDITFNLSGKAKGAELVLTLRFQIMEKDGGIGIYRQAEAIKTGRDKNLSSAFARKQSKTSFSIPSPRMSARAEPRTPSKMRATPDDLQGIDDLNLDEAAPAPSSTVSAPQKLDDLDPPDFEVVDKGVEISEKEIGERVSQGTAEDRSTSGEVVKEMLLDQLHMTRLTELDSIAQQIKALESIMVERKTLKDEDTESQRLDAEEENVTREFLQMLEDEELNEFKLDQHHVTPLQLQAPAEAAESETKVYLSDLGKGLGCVVQTRDGGYLAAMNPLNAVITRKDTPKLAIQISKPLVLPFNNSVSGFELFQRMAVVGLEALGSQILSHMPMDELMGKTAEQMAFEGIASAIIQGRNKEGASSSAARSIAIVKTMATAMNAGRKERISTGIWNVNENPLTAEEVLAFSLQKIEATTIEALKIQAEMAEEDAPFDVSSHSGKAVKDARTDTDTFLASAVPLEDWMKSYSSTSSEVERGDPGILTLALLVQLRDPIRRYEAVGGPMLAVVHATHVDEKAENYDREKRYKVTSLHVGGLKVWTTGKNSRDTERQRLTAMQWLVAYGLGKGGRKVKQGLPKGQDLFWSMSSRVMADMWLKPMRNPDIKFATNIGT